MKELFAKARKVSVPLCLIKTADPAATIRSIREVLDADAAEKKLVTPLMQWDFARGINGVNQQGVEIIDKIASENGGDKWRVTMINPVAMANAANLLPGEPMPGRRGCVLIMHNAHFHLSTPAFIQAIWNLRDTLKSNRRMVVMLCPDVSLPAELSNDVLVIDDPLPTKADMITVIAKQFKATPDCVNDAETIERAAAAITGLPAFTGEQAAVLSLERKDGKVQPNIDTMWTRKQRMVEATPGLSVWRGNNTFDAVGGCTNVKAFMRRLINSKKKYNAIVFIDEIEKMFGGSGDTSGVSQAQLGKVLSEMQENEYDGVMFIGFPGSGKSEIAKCTGATAGVPTVWMDTGDMKGGLVGQSEARTSMALKTIKAISEGSALFVSTCNKIASLPPELRRRFRKGTFFFDFPDAEERAAIWEIYLRKYNLKVKAKDMPDDEGWTGAEVRAVTSMADEMDMSLREASGYIVPVYRSMGQAVRDLRMQANDTFINASKPGYYKMPKDFEQQAMEVRPVGITRMTEV